MADTDVFSDLEVFSKTLWGEARGEGEEGMQAIACVVLNRVKSGIVWWGNDSRSVCLKPYQFSCWNKSDPNRSKIMEVTSEDQQYAIAYSIAQMALSGGLPDVTNGSDSYYDRRMPTIPKWAANLKPSATIGHHLFFVTVHPVTKVPMA